jgi:formyltetrahydrofolate synthetase
LNASAKPTVTVDLPSPATLKPIGEIAEKAGIPSDALEPYGHYKAKIDINPPIGFNVD